MFRMEMACGTSQERGGVPELPEVETVRRDLEPALRGRRVTSVVVTRDRAVRRQRHDEFIAMLTGSVFGDVRRHGKFLMADLDSGDALIGHLRMSGQLRIASRDDELAKHTHVVVDLDDGMQLRFVDPRTFGELFIASEVQGLGPDALDRMTPTAFHARLKGRRTIKAVLLDQRTIAGVGNIYADEALFAAGIHPQRLAPSITVEEAAVLLKEMRRILRAAIRARGSSIDDYVDAYGRAGGFARRHKVYGRTGQPCPNCGTPVEKTVTAQRGTHFCRSCQT
jgi:formamidopyrimidine-DNA glycosylase